MGTPPPNHWGGPGTPTLILWGGVYILWGGVYMLWDPP